MRSLALVVVLVAVVACKKSTPQGLPPASQWSVAASATLVHAAAADLPPGHPPIAASSSLPADHPPVLCPAR